MPSYAGRGQSTLLIKATRALLVGLTSLGVPELAKAEEPAALSVPQLRQEVRDRQVRAGNQSVRDLRDDAAAAAWALAYALSPDPTMLTNLADSCRRLGQLREAYVLLQRFLQEDPGTPRKLEIEEQIRQLLVRFGNQPRPRAVMVAQEHVQPGVSAYSRQDFLLATREFALAYALSPTPDLLYNLANTQRKLDAKPEAIVLYEQYLKSTGTPAQRANAEAYRGQLLVQLQTQLAAKASESPPASPAVSPAESPAESPTHPSMKPAPQPPAPIPPPLPPPPAKPATVFPYLDGALGGLWGGRFLRASTGGSGACQVLRDPRSGRYESGPCPELALPATYGLQVDLAVFPLAGSKLRFIQGLGLDVKLEVQPNYSVCGNDMGDSTCAGGNVTGSRIHIAIGVRWDVNLKGQRGAPTFGLYARYGYDRQELSASVDGTLLRSLPSLNYQYVDAGLSVGVPIWRRQGRGLRTALRLGYLAPFSYGELSQPLETEPERARFPPVRLGHGVRVDATLLEITPWRGLILQLSGGYQLIYVELGDRAAATSAPAFLVGSFADHRVSLGINIGYRY